MAVLGLTACEKGLDVGEDNASTGQVKNSVLQVRTRGASGDEARVAYPVAVYVFEGDECKASQTIGDEGQTLNIGLTEGTWKNNGSTYLLPPCSQPASVSVNITVGGTTKTYTYNTSDEMEAGYKINIDGTYTEAVGVNLTGTITGATWLGERTISFTFGVDGISDWTVPTKAQMDAFAAERNDVIPAPAAGIYLYKNNNGVYYQSVVSVVGHKCH